MPTACGKLIRLQLKENKAAMKLTTRIYLLSRCEIERFDCIYNEGPRGQIFHKGFIEEARWWRSQRQQELKTNAHWRWRYLANLCGSDPSPTPETPMHNIPSSARYLCWRVEMEVMRMDANATHK